MPSLTELLTKAGVTIPAGVNLVELVESSDEIKGLATAKNDLHQWKLENKPLLEQLQSEQEALKQKAKEDEEARLKLAKENGDYKTQLEIESKRAQELLAGLNASRERTQKAALEAAQTSLASLMNDPIYGKYYAEKSVLVELNEIGEPVTKFKFGEQVFDKLDDWKAVAVKDQTIASKITVGGQSQSPAATGQTGGQGGQQPQQPKLSNATQGYMANLKP